MAETNLNEVREIKNIRKLAILRNGVLAKINFADISGVKTYSPDSSYVVNDVIIFEGLQYRCISPVSGFNPEEDHLGVFWKRVSAIHSNSLDSTDELEVGTFYSYHDSINGHTPIVAIGDYPSDEELRTNVLYSVNHGASQNKAITTSKELPPDEDLVVGNMYAADED